jgi:hypothetical protein
MKYSKLIPVILLGFTLFSCHKILDKKDLSSVNQQDVWNDLDLATAYVNRIYAQDLPEWSTTWSNYSDESGGGGDHMYGQLTENSVDYWPYDHLRDINVLLANIDQGSLSSANKELLKGQAYFFRAWLYFQMVIRYGGVPLILKPEKLSDDLLVQRAPTSVCMQQIVADLDSAIADLPVIDAASGENDGHIHKGTALAVRGRVLLYYASPQFDPDQTATGRWQAAYNANKAAMDYLEAHGFGLYGDFAGIWTNEMNKGDIFVRRYQYSPDNDMSYSHWAAATRPLDASQGSTGGNRPTLEMVNAFPMKDGKAAGDPTSAYQYDPDYFWKNRDPRFKETIAYNGSLWELSGESGRIEWTYAGGEQNNPTPSGFYCRKAVDESQDPIEAYESSTDWVEIRFAEVLLNFAESADETGKPTEAYPELVAIRKRAGIDPGTDNLYGLKAGMDQAEMLDAIMNERRIEFAFEGKRYWDLRRRRLFGKLLNGTRREGYTIALKIPEAQWNNLRNTTSSPDMLNLLDQHYTDYFSHTVKQLDTQFDINWPDNYYFFAIPSKYLELDSKLEQTNGWDGGTFDPLK